MLYDDQDYVNNVEKVRDRVFIIYPGGMPVKLPLLNYYRGDRFSLTLIGRNIDNTPFDFTGAELTLQIKKDPDCEEFLGELSSFNNYLLEQSEDGRAYDIEQGNALDTTLDIITLFDPLGEFTTINEEIVFHDLQMNYFDTIITIVRGFFRIIKDVTRKPVFVPDPEPVILPKTYVKPIIAEGGGTGNLGGNKTKNVVTLSGTVGIFIPPPKIVGLQKSFNMVGNVITEKPIKVSLNKDFKMSFVLTDRKITKFIVSLSKEFELDGAVTPIINEIAMFSVRLTGKVGMSGSLTTEKIPYDDEGEVIPPPEPNIITISLYKQTDMLFYVGLGKSKLRSLSRVISLDKTIGVVAPQQYTIGLVMGISLDKTIGMTIN